MFMDIWDKDNTSIRINKFAVLIDCLMFMLSDTFTYLFESEDIDYIIITAGKKVMFEYDNRE